MSVQPYSVTLDGVIFTGELPFHISEEKPELGPLTDAEDVHRFNQVVVARTSELGLQGPETFRFCRKVGRFSMAAIAELLGANRATVQRWENGEAPIPRPMMAVTIFLALGAPPSMMALLENLGNEAERPREVAIAVGDQEASW